MRQGAPDANSRVGRLPDSTEVIIVGLGPTGATLANLLAECGVGVIAVDREAGIYDLPRAVHFDGETMRVFQSAGISQKLSHEVIVNPGMRFVGPDGELLLDWPRPQVIGPQGWHASYRLHQPDLERLLREKLADRPNVSMLTSTEVVSIEPRDCDVVVTCRDTRNAQTSYLSSSYVVGCDGARSFVRSVIGSGSIDLGFRERWLVVDVLLKRNRPDLGNHSIQYCSPDRPMTYCRSPKNRRRWEIAVRDEESDKQVTSKEWIWPFLSRWIGPDDADLERRAVYTFRSEIAQTWRKDRLMIAGDAAHLTPPFMGQGMCAGIRDAVNLAWKLALCVKGAAKCDILDSYQEERAPNVRSFIETAMRLGGLVNTLDKKSALSLGSQDESGVASMESISPPLGPSDLGGLIALDTPHKGRLFPQPTLGDGQLLDDAIGFNPALIVRGRLPGQIAAAVPVVEAEDSSGLAAALAGLDATAVLIRPDRYIAASARSEVEKGALAVLTLPSPASGHARAGRKCAR